nr:hypothetical protein [uncultured Brumimicrobium sp.]
MGSRLYEEKALAVPRILHERAHATSLLNLIMLKSLLLKYPLTLEEVDRLIIYMVYFNIDTIEELALKTDEELEKNGEWTERVKPLIQTVRDHTPLK